ncbi:type II toxin-antitoxin system RelE/ParE family toxin [Xenorhabdus bovienii]|uniref:type II toxin-antitoxin system RelE/ParE family toxin n=1 Tax=Xenorhabdus bovienii TaxID=40576 RepID=UPI00237C8FBB|nr:type II toxin-antitoxin system RelE/ParE family toxin [Xenorhabdus bovienii]
MWWRPVIRLLWEETAQADREQIYRYFYEQAGLLLADKVDARFQEMAELLKTAPYSGVKIRNNIDESYRKLIVPHFPFILLYQYIKENSNIRILRVLHTSRQITSIF